MAALVEEEGAPPEIFVLEHLDAQLLVARGTGGHLLYNAVQGNTSQRWLPREDLGVPSRDVNRLLAAQGSAGSAHDEDDGAALLPETASLDWRLTRHKLPRVHAPQRDSSQRVRSSSHGGGHARCYDGSEAQLYHQPR